ncbi:MAG: Tm-1-like ATP-binding domain-containing protein [Acidobacteria bacterium]|nr:Tm-1-like ATP-binding domain-containing protein [Acidobacteriota bacterium]
MAIAVCGMLDEREVGLQLIRTYLEQRGHEAVVVDFSIGTGGIAPTLRADITCDDVAIAGGTTSAEIRAGLSSERDKVTAAMARGLAARLDDLHRAGRLQGVIAVAGMTGTLISLPAFKALPFGLPKVLVSSAAALPRYADYYAQFFSLNDITVMHSVVDTVGMNGMLRTILRNAAGAVCGMVDSYEGPVKATKPAVAITEYGFAEQCAHYVREQLEHEFDLVSFHAQGLGDMAFEHLVGQRLFDGAIDLVPSAIGEYILGGNRPSGPDRLENAGTAGIPYVLAPCGFDILSSGPISRKDGNDPLWTSRRLAERKMFLQDSARVQVRTSADEMKLVARTVAERLNRYPNRALVKFLVPTRGFSTLGAAGGPLHEPDTDRAFVDELKQLLDPDIEVIEVDTHLNTPEFARAVVAAFRAAWALRVAR